MDHSLSIKKTLLFRLSFLKSFLILMITMIMNTKDLKRTIMKLTLLQVAETCSILEGHTEGYWVRNLINHFYLVSGIFSTSSTETETIFLGLKNSLSKIKTNHGKTLQYQAMLRAFEAKDRSVMEHNYERVNFWSLVHLCAMVGTAMLQVF